MQGHFKLTNKQSQQLQLVKSEATHIMSFGGSRSAKTFGIVRTMIIRALAAENSRHAILRFRFNHVKASVVLDTFPKVMSLCFKDITYELNKTDWYPEFPNKSQIWFGGLDDKERTEKVLGQEYATIFLNECSQITWEPRNMAVTRLAQLATITGTDKPLRLKMFYDCNPPAENHWTYKIFKKLISPDTGKPLTNIQDFASIKMNPADNIENLPDTYIATLEALPPRMKKRFLEGMFTSVTDNALWSIDSLDKIRDLDVSLPDFLRVVIAVDPSGADSDNCENDAIGICVVALGVDGRAYVLEDLTVKGSPSVWGKVATDAFQRHQADRIIGEANYGGDMVRHVIQTARPSTPYKAVTASRGKVQRAEPISALCDVDKVVLAGNFPDLEEELCSFTTSGYIGENSPNRADAFIWAITELFPGMTKELKSEETIFSIPKLKRL